MSILGFIREKKKKFGERIKENQQSSLKSNEEKLERIKTENKRLAHATKINKELTQEKTKQREMRYAKVKQVLSKIPKPSQSKDPFAGSPFGSPKGSISAFGSTSEKKPTEKKKRIIIEL